MVTIYVSKEGDNSTGDGSLENTYLTIGKALLEAQNGDIISVAPGTYGETLLIDKSGIQIQSTLGLDNRPIITSSGVTVAIAHSTSNIALTGLEIISTSASVEAIAIRKQQSFSSNSSGLPVLESLPSNILITQNIIRFGKYAMTVNARNSSITNNTFHQTVSTSNTLMLIYSLEDLTISGNIWQSHVGSVSRVFYLATGGAGEYRSGVLNITTNNITTTVGNSHFIMHEMTRNHPDPSKRMSYNVSNNNFNHQQASTGGFLILFPTNSTNPAESVVTRIQDILLSNTSGGSVVEGNVVTNPYRGFVYVDLAGGEPQPSAGGFFRLDGFVGPNPNTFTGSLSQRPGSYDVDGAGKVLLSATPVSTENWSTFYTSTAGGASSTPPTFPEQVISIIQGNSDSFDIGTVIGLGSEQGITVPLVKKASSGEVSSTFNPDSELNATLTMKTPTTLASNIQRALGVFKSNYRSTINSMNVIVQFAVKFVNTDTEEFDSSIGSSYRLSIPTHPNRRYLTVYKELANGSSGFVTNASLVTGQTDVYEFSIPSNSVYSIVDPELFFLPGVVGPYWLNGKLALGGRVLTDANGELLSNLTIDNENSVFATGDVEIGGDVMIGEELAVTGQSTFSANVSVNAPLTVTDNFVVDVDTFIVNASSNNVGIGKTNPAVKLDVIGAITSTTTITASHLAGTIDTAAQPNITSVGNLTSLNVVGNLTVDTNVLYVDSSSNRVGINNSAPTQALDISGNAFISGSMTASNIYGTIQTVSQPNITTVGTLTSLSVAGLSQLSGNVGIGTSARSDTNLFIYDPHRPDSQSMKRFLFGGYSNGNPYGIMLENGTSGGYSPTLRGKAYDNDDEGLVMIGQLTGAGDAVGRTCFKLDGRQGDAGYGNPVNTARLLEISNYAVPRFVVLANGNVGMGITAPTEKLGVSGNATVTGSVTAASLVISGNVTVDGGVLHVNSSSNRVGINTLTPTKDLDVVGDGLVTGTFTATNLVGTLLTTAQPNITSVGTLISLDVTGDATFDSGTLKVDSLNNRVGINTSSPAYALDVIGSSAVSGDLSIGGTLEIDNVVSGTSVLNIGCTTTTTTLNLACGSGVQHVNIGANDSVGATTINIGGPGDVVNIAGTVTTINATNTDIKDKNITLNKGGAATSAFGAGFEIEENNTITGFIKLNSNRDAWIIGAPEDSYSDAAQIVTTEGPLFVKSGSDLFYTAGNVGIGLTNPSVALDVVGAGKFSSDVTVGSDVFKVNVTSGHVGIGYSGVSTYTLSVDGHAHLTTGNSFYIASSQVLSETTLGSSVVNSSLTSVGTLASLNVAGNLAVDTNVLFVDATNNRVGVNTSSPGFDLEVVGNGYLSGNMTVNTDLTVNGDIYNNSMQAGNGVPLALDSYGKVVKATSSRRYKDNIQPLEERTSPREVIASLQPVVFEYKNVPGQKVYGLIAEDVEQVNQDLVIYKDDQVDGVHYMQIIPLLIAEIKNLRQELAEVRNMVAGQQ